MDRETQGSTAIAVNFRLNDQGFNEKSSKDSYKTNYGIVLDIPVVLNSEENASVGGESRNLQVGDQEPDHAKQIRDSMEEGTSGNSSDSGEIASIIEKNKDIAIKIDETGLNTGISDQGSYGNAEALSRVEQESNRNSVGSAGSVVLETMILASSEENQSSREGTSRLEIKGSEFETSKVMVDKSIKNVSEEKKESCVIDVRCGNEGFKDCEGERVCRICHLSEGLAETKATSSSMELIQLGCGCKDELSIAHVFCAEAWFKLKGNRICEICGAMAKNVTGVGDNRFMEEWNERRYVGSGISFPPDGSNGCWRGQPLCNFLMACLVVAFVLPWFFRVNMF